MMCEVPEGIVCTPFQDTPTVQLLHGKMEKTHKQSQRQLPLTLQRLNPGNSHPEINLMVSCY
jgi:hypothetical protein